MNKNHKRIKYLSFSLIMFLAITVGTLFYGMDKPEATNNPKFIDSQLQPAHPYAYKLGNEEDIESSIENYERVTAKQREVLLAQREAKEAERIAKEEQEQKLAEEQKKKAEEEAELAKAVEEAEPTQSAQPSKPATSESKSNTESKSVKTTQSSSSATSSSTTTQKTSEPKTEVKTEAPKQAEAKPAPAPQPKPEPKKPSIGSNKIGINGVYKSYTNYGRASTEKLQSGIDAGLIVAGLNSFNGNDGATTYFGGHNPGIMKFMENNIYVGATVTITDSNGQAFNYKMIDKVDVDEYGEGMLTSIGRSAIDAYMYGTGTESILIQFCNTNNYLMSFWYGVKI